MKEVHNVNEAKDFFMSNCTDKCLCIKGDTSLIVNCYPDALTFFENN